MASRYIKTVFSLPGGESKRIIVKKKAPSSKGIKHVLYTAKNNGCNYDLTYEIK